jgi:hypothetical protein
MSIEGFDYEEQYIGTDDTSAYEFSFKIFDPSQLRFYIQDQLGNILADNLDGTDTIWCSGVTYDSIEGGGILNLVSPLPNAFSLSIFLANDAPAQPAQFPNKTSFTLEAIEGALDYLGAAIQRIAFLGQRALRLHDLDDVTQWDMRLPNNLSDFPLAILTINADGNGFALGPTTTVLNQLVAEAAASAAAAEASALDSQNSAVNALASENAAANDAVSAENSANSATASALAAAASAAQAAGSGFLTLPEITCTEGIETVLTTVDAAIYKSATIFFEVERGVTVFADGWFSVQYKNGTWRQIDGPYLGDDTDMFWTISQVGLVATVKALPNVGAGDAKIILKLLLFKKP